MSGLTPTPINDLGSEMMGHRPSLSEDYSIIDGNTDSYTGLTPDLDMVLGDAHLSFPLPQGPFPDSRADSLSDLTELVCPSFFADTSSSHEVDTASARREGCSCSKMVCAYEMAEVYLVWGPRNHAGAMSIEMDDMLRCQKTVLASCEAVLSCDLCSLQSEQVMLMISICNKLLASFVQMSADPPSIATPPSVNSKQDLIRPISPRSSLKSKGLNFTVSEWKIDDEDKKQVLRTLLRSRAARLNDLMDRLGAVARTNRWLVHSSLIRDLLECFTEHQSIWEP